MQKERTLQSSKIPHKPDFARLLSVKACGGWKCFTFR